jgi:hypothetical protein
LLTAYFISQKLPDKLAFALLFKKCKQAAQSSFFFSPQTFCIHHYFIPTYLFGQCPLYLALANASAFPFRSQNFQYFYCGAAKKHGKTLNGQCLPLKFLKNFFIQFEKFPDQIRAFLMSYIHTAVHDLSSKKAPIVQNKKSKME